MMFLLDVNALLAMRHMNHVHHTRVGAWVSQQERTYGRDHLAFATCPITELGFVRIGSGTAGYAASVDAARTDLQDLKSNENMLFIPDDLHTHYLPSWVRKSAQTTDGYLLALAKSHGGHLATLDRFIPGAMFISGEDSGALEVRDETAPSDWAALSLQRALDETGSQGIVMR
jgi:predicted nucleic acid-binding protein